MFIIIPTYAQTSSVNLW